MMRIEFGVVVEEYGAIPYFESHRWRTRLFTSPAKLPLTIVFAFEIKEILYPAARTVVSRILQTGESVDPFSFSNSFVGFMQTIGKGSGEQSLQESRIDVPIADGWVVKAGYRSVAFVVRVVDENGIFTIKLALS